MNGEARPSRKKPQHFTLLDCPISIPYGWLVAVSVLLLQFALFSHRASREVTWAYPTSFDQNSYLSQSYETFDQMLKTGFLGGLRYGLGMNLPQGRLLHVQAASLFLFLGPSRLSALTLNFFYFALLEFLLLYTARWLTGSWSVGLMGVGLLLATTTRFQNAGGMLDFRIDFIASCLFGIFICLVVRSGIFRSLGWSIATGVATGVLIDFRFLTSVLVVPLLCTILGFLIVRAWRSRSSRKHRVAAMVRIKRLMLVIVITFLLTAPAVWMSRSAIVPYYFGHVTSGEAKIRLVEYGAASTADYLLYYPKSLLTEHLGKDYVILCIFLIPVVLATGQKFQRSIHRLSPFSRQVCLVFIGASLFVPFLVLTAWPSRSPVVATLLVASVVANTILFLVWLAVKIGPQLNFKRSAITPSLLAGLVMAGGTIMELNGATKHALPPGDWAEYRAIAELYDEIGTRSLHSGLTQPQIVFDRIWDFLHVSILTPLYYERHGILLKPQSVIGTTVFPVSDQAAMDAVVHCDMAVLTSPTSPDPPDFVYPYNVSMKGRYASLLTAVEQNLIPVRKFHIFSQDLTLYVRPAIHSEIPAGEWITSAGVVLSAVSDELRAHPVVELSGRTILSHHLGEKLQVRAVVTDDSKVLEEAATTMKPSENYRVSLRLNPKNIPSSGTVRIRLLFDRFFVPRQIGLNDDSRELVIMMPTSIRLLPE